MAGFTPSAPGRSAPPEATSAPSGRAYRRKARSDRRAARHNALSLRASDGSDASAAAAPLPPDSLVEPVTLRPAVARALDAEAARIGLERACYVRVILEEFAARLSGREAAPAAALVDEHEIRIPDGYVDADSLPPVPPAPPPAAPRWRSLVEQLPIARIAAAFARVTAPGSDRPVYLGMAAAAVVLLLLGAWGFARSNRYQLSPSAPGAVFMLDRWTGDVWNCAVELVESPDPGCRRVFVRDLPEGLTYTEPLRAVD